MSRTLSDAWKTNFFPLRTGAILVALLTIDHDALAAPIRACNQRSDQVSNGETFPAFPFAIGWPADSEGRPPQTTLVIANVDAEIMDQLRALPHWPPASLQLELAFKASIDTIEQTISDFEIQEINYNAATISARIGLDSLDNEPFPGFTFNEDEWRGVHQAAGLV